MLSDSTLLGYKHDETIGCVTYVGICGEDMKQERLEGISGIAHVELEEIGQTCSLLVSIASNRIVWQDQITEDMVDIVTIIDGRKRSGGGCADTRRALRAGIGGGSWTHPAVQVGKLRQKVFLDTYTTQTSQDAFI